MTLLYVMAIVQNYIGFYKNCKFMLIFKDLILLDVAPKIRDMLWDTSTKNLSPNKGHEY